MTIKCGGMMAMGRLQPTTVDKSQTGMSGKNWNTMLASVFALYPEPLYG